MRRPTAPRPPPPIVPNDAAGHRPGHITLAKAHRPQHRRAGTVP
jgi:hypothetical protein